MKNLGLTSAIILALIITIFFGHFWIVLIRIAVWIIFSPITWVILIALFFITRKRRVN